MSGPRTWTLKIRGDAGDALSAADKVERRYKNLDINKGLSGKMDRLKAKFSSFASSLASTGQTIAKGLAIGAVGGIAALGAGIVSTFKAASESIKVGKQTSQVIKTMGAGSWTSAGKVGALASKMSNLTAVDDEVIQQGANLLLTFGKVRNEVGKGNDIFDRGVRVANDMSVALGTDMKSSSLLLGKALNDPIKGITALTRSGVSFTQKQKDQITTLVKSGKTLEAQRLILKEVESQFGGTAAAVATPWERLKVTLGNLSEEIGARFVPIINLVAQMFVDKLPGAIDKAKTVVNAFMSALRGEGVTSDGIVGVAERIGVAVRAAWPHVQRIAGAVRDFGERIVGFFKNNPKVLFAGLAVVIGGLLLAAVVGVGSALVAVISPFIAVVAVVAAVAGAVTYAYTRWGWFRDAVDAVVSWFKSSALPTLQEFARAVGDAFARLVQWFKSSALPRLQEFATTVRAAFADLVEWVRANWPKVQAAVGRVVEWFKNTAWPAIQGFVGRVREVFAGVVAWIKQIWPQVSEAIGHVLKVIMVIVGIFVVTAMALWRTFGDTILTFAKNAWDAIWRAIQGALQVIRGIIQTVLALINGDWGKAWDGILLVLTGAWGLIRGALELALAAVLGVLSLGLDAIQGVWNIIWGGITDGFGAIWRGITNGARNGVNAVIKVLNWFIRLINKIPGVDISEISEVGASGGGGGDGRTGRQEFGGRRATGGFMTNRGGRGGEYVVGEGNRFRPEAVIATDPRYRRRNLGLWAWAGKKLGAPGFERGGVPGYAMGGIPNPINAVKSAAGAVADWGRDLSVKALGPIRDQARSMVGSIPGGDRTKFIRDMGRGIIDKMYNWARGKTEEHEAAMASSGGGGSAKGLVGNAAAAFRIFREIFPNMTIGGWRAHGSVPGSDHPHGKALDLMTGSSLIAGRIINTFMGQQGRKYWIWNRHIATAARGWTPRPYHGPSPHTDHVHLSYYRKGGVTGFAKGTGPGGLPEDIMGVGPSGRRYKLHRGEGVTSTRDMGQPGGITIGQIVVYANTPAEGRAAGRAAYQAILAERAIITDARIA